MKVTKEQKDTLYLIIYLLKKLNFLSRDNVRQLFGIMKEEAPEDIEAWLKDDVARGEARR